MFKRFILLTAFVVFTSPAFSSDYIQQVFKGGFGKWVDPIECLAAKSLQNSITLPTDVSEEMWIYTGDKLYQFDIGGQGERIVRCSMWDNPKLETD